MQKTPVEKTLIEPPAAVASTPVPSATPPRAGDTPFRSDIPAAPADEAGGGSQPYRYIAVEIGFYSLNLRVAADVDLDDRFRATCLDTGDALWVNGWLIDSSEDIEPAQVLA